MRLLSPSFFLITAFTAVNGQYFCNGGTNADPSIRCAQGQYVYCCDAILNTQSDPTRKQGFPTFRQCGKTGASCTVKNNAGNGLFGFAACC
ncbi:uncharacterized protein CTRU02_210866 [Colletotrichum truncatum]|uniref:Uncharacterized protein n=1 Tax=Colletotrichum truncatum TaxID=5467 RepID=A0ACC3YSD9_COLTU